MEESVTIKQARKHFEGHPHYNTIWRWCKYGVYVDSIEDYIRLRSKLVGRRRFIPLSAIKEFKDALNSL